MKNLFLKSRLFICLGAIIFLFLLSYAFPVLFFYAKVALGLLLLLVLIDVILLFAQRRKISVSRRVNPKLSLGDLQKINYKIENASSLKLDVELIDELPEQFQHRESIGRYRIQAQRKLETYFEVKPTLRDLYQFGNSHLYISTPFLSLVEWRISFDNDQEIKVVPSIIQMKKYELQVFSKSAIHSGVRRIRQIGENDEFEHIRAYNQGDNINAINWNATSRLNKIMINQYQNTKSQNLYCLIDKGRSMKMPFEDLTLLDYAINSSLVISNIVLRKYDRAGLITFSNKLGALVKAESTRSQLEKISDHLYNQKTDFQESSIELLNITVRKKISRRSILVLFTNFENQQDFQRNLKHLKAINRRHLLVVVFFINTALIETSEMRCKTEDEIYLKTFAQRMLLEKELVRMELTSNGIQAILTKPQDLSINVINKYLEIKAKRMI